MATNDFGDLTPASGRLSRRAMLKRAATFSGIALLSAACGAPAPATEAEPTDAPAAEAQPSAAQAASVQPNAEAPAGEVTTIRFSSVGWGGWLAEPWNLIVSRFNESQSAVQIPAGYEDIAEGYEKVMAQAAGGVAADVYTFETKQMPAFASRDFFTPLDEFITSSSAVKKDSYFADDWNEMTWSGKQFMVPFDNSPAMIWYNPDLFEEAGIAPPPDKYGSWKWEDFLATSKAMTSGDGAEKVYGWAGERGWVYALNWIWSNGGWLLNEEKTECVIDMPETVEALKWAADLVLEHQVQPEAAAIEQGGNSALFYAGRAAMAQRGTWWAIDLKAQEGLNWNVAPQPDGAAGAFVRNPLDAWGIWSGSKSPAAAWQFIEFLSQDESLVELTNAGLSVSKTAVMESDAFLKQEPADVNWQLFVDALDGHTRRHPDTAIFAEMDDLLETEWGAVLDGAQTVEQMVEKVKGPINDLLAECISKGDCEGTA